MSTKGLAFVFPGQGSQRSGMLAAAARQHPAVLQTFAEASQTQDYDLWDLIQNGDQRQLNLTEITQPVLLACSVALWRSWRAAGGLQPSLLAGHSLGEFSALVCAGVLTFEDGLRLVRKRGAFMQSAVPVGEGAMVAIIGLDDDTINQICADTAASTGGVVSAVNFNSPGQVVIAGHTAAVEAAAEHCKLAGARRALPLPVSAPFHTLLMQPAREKLAAELSRLTLRVPEIPVLHNVHAEIEPRPEQIARLLADQLCSPVLWTACVQAMLDRDVSCIVECGPGKVLSGLNRRIDKSLESYAIEQPEELASTLARIGAA